MLRTPAPTPSSWHLFHYLLYEDLVSNSHNDERMSFLE